MKKLIDLNRNVNELCTENPEILDILKELGFTDITKPGMLQTVGRFMTIPKGAAMKKIDLKMVKETLINKGYTLHEEDL